MQFFTFCSSSTISSFSLFSTCIFMGPLRCLCIHNNFVCGQETRKENPECYDVLYPVPPFLVKFDRYDAFSVAFMCLLFFLFIGFV